MAWLAVQTHEPTQLLHYSPPPSYSLFLPNSETATAKLLRHCLRLHRPKYMLGGWLVGWLAGCCPDALMLCRPSLKVFMGEFKFKLRSPVVCTR